MPMQTWESVLNSPGNGAGAALTNSTTGTDISPNPQLFLPANYLYVGQKLRLTANGIFSTPASGGGTLTLGFYYGGILGSALATTAATTVVSATNWPWRLQCDLEVRSVGATGTIAPGGVSFIGTAVSAWTCAPLPPAPFATVTIDTTSGKALTVGATWSVASASDTVTCEQFIIEACN